MPPSRRCPGPMPSGKARARPVPSRTERRRRFRQLAGGRPNRWGRLCPHGGQTVVPSADNLRAPPGIKERHAYQAHEGLPVSMIASGDRACRRGGGGEGRPGSVGGPGDRCPGGRHRPSPGRLRPRLVSQGGPSDENRRLPIRGVTNAARQETPILYPHVFPLALSESLPI
jgi:hypothetical protein